MRFVSIFICFFVCAGAAFSATTEITETQTQKIALVVGIGNYDSAGRLPNAVSDAKAVSSELWRSGFEVVEAIDVDIRALRAKLTLVANRIDEGAVATMYFAGHGIQIAGENFLLARDVDVTSATLDNVRTSAIAASEIINILNENGAAVSIVILDACRDNPFPDADNDGLAIIEQPVSGEVLIAYSTAPNQVALDGPPNGNSPYTAALVQHMADPSLEVGLLFRQVRRDVREATGGLQLPWINSSLERTFTFRETDYQPDRGIGTATNLIGNLPPQDVIEQALWQTALGSGNRDDVLQYIHWFPNGKYQERAYAMLSSGDKEFADQVFAQKYQANAEDLIVASRIELPAGTSGPLPIGLTTDRGLQEADVRIAGIPEGLEIFNTDGSPVQVGQTFSVSELAALEYRARPETVGALGNLQIETRFTAGDDALSVEIAATIDPCDMVAGYPHDPNRVGRGARLELMVPELAIDACATAVERFPETLRFKALLSRGYRAAENWDEARRWNDIAMAEGYTSAFCAEAKMFVRGQGRPVNPAAGLPLATRAVSKGDLGCKAELGRMYLLGLGTDKDTERGLGLIRESASIGNDWAYVLLGQAYERGLGVEKSPETAFDWYELSADSGSPIGKLHVARMYRDGIGVPQDYAAALNLYEDASGQGFGRAEAEFGRLFADGKIVEQDLETAIYWYEKAIEHRDLRGRLYLAQALLDGAGIAKDTDRALALLTHPSQALHPLTLAFLGDLYRDGTHVPRDDATAIDYLHQAVAAGHMGSARRLAGLYLKGDGVARDPAQARDLLTTAAEAGSLFAMRDLGRLLKSGDGIAEDPPASAAWTERAAAGGNVSALRDHAKNLETGYGRAADPDAAYIAMTGAVRSGSPWVMLDFARYHKDGIGTAPNRPEEAFWLARVLATGNEGAAATAQKRLANVPLDDLIVAAGLLMIEAGIVANATNLATDTIVTTLEQVGTDPTSASSVASALVTIAAGI